MYLLRCPNTRIMILFTKITECEIRGKRNEKQKKKSRVVKNKGMVLKNGFLVTTNNLILNFFYSHFILFFCFLYGNSKTG